MLKKTPSTAGAENVLWSRTPAEAEKGLVDAITPLMVRFRVPQVVSDEPADVLLKRIKASKQLTEKQTKNPQKA